MIVFLYQLNCLFIKDIALFMQNSINTGVFPQIFAYCKWAE